MKIMLGHHLSDEHSANPDVVEAFAALEKLPASIRERVCKVAMGKIMGENARSRGSILKGATLSRFLGKRAYGDYYQTPVPGQDHAQIFRRDGVSTYVSQPYALDMRTLREIVPFCDEYELDAHVHGRSWYNPGSTLVLEFTRRDR